MRSSLNRDSNDTSRGLPRTTAILMFWPKLGRVPTTRSQKSHCRKLGLLNGCPAYSGYSGSIPTGHTEMVFTLTYRQDRPATRHTESPTVRPTFSYFPVFGSPTTTLEVVGNTENPSSEKAGVGGSTPSLATTFCCTYESETLRFWVQLGAIVLCPVLSM